MKIRFLLPPAIVATIVFIAAELFASGPGGIVSNPNQSPEWIRTLNRYASTGVDAVFFNPAGAVKLEDGTHIGFSNQSSYKKSWFNDDSPVLPRDEYTSYVLSSVFPNLHVAHKKDGIAYMFGFDIMTGGGAGTHEDGLPFSDYIGVVDGLGGQEGASAKSEFGGSFAGAGFSIGAAYAINDVLSVAGQLRYIYTFGSNTATVTPFLNGVEQPTEELDMSLSGNSYGFIVGANIAPTEALNIGIRYSYYTKMELLQEINDGKDLYGTFTEVDGTESDSTIPQDIALGVSYHITPRWRVESSFIFYYNEGTDWSDERGPNIENGWEAGVSVEYAVLPDKLLASIGYLYSKKGLPDELQYDVSNKLDAFSYGMGATYYFKPTLDATFAYVYSGDDEVVNYDSKNGSTQKIKSNSQTFAIGFNIRF